MVATTTTGLATVVLDPSKYLDDAGVTRLAIADQPVWLPTWIPNWAHAIKPVVKTLATQTGEAGISWNLPIGGLDPNRDSALALKVGTSITIEVSRSKLDPDAPFPFNLPMVKGTNRTYYADAGTLAEKCPSTSEADAQLSWSDNKYWYSVFMSPGPGCFAGFDLKTMIAFGDSLILCDATGGKQLVCDPPPLPTGG